MSAATDGPGGVAQSQRLAAIGALACGVAMVVVLGWLLVASWGYLLLAVVSLSLTAGAVVRSVALTGWRRLVWTVLGVVGLIGVVVCLVSVGMVRPWASLLFVALALVGLRLAVYARRGYVRPAAAPAVAGPRLDVRAQRAVLFLNPKSGGGKVGEFDLVEEARRRGVETVVLGADDDLTALAERAVADGAGVLGMAGGDGSQADVAAVAVAHDLPFVCIAAGTRNHFALDLDLDRSDPRLGLDAFVEGVERRVDYGLAGDRFFVNNVSLGIYPYVVQDPAYRDGRLKAAASIIPELMRPDSPTIDLRFSSPDGVAYTTAQVLLVSNNPYRGFGAIDGAGRRVSLDGGVLGVLVVAADDPEQLARATHLLTLGKSVDGVDGFDQWSATGLRIESSSPTVLAGVDGEAMDLPAPLDIRIVPGGLRVLVPIDTPAPPEPQPSALSVEAIGSLFEIAGGVAPGPFGDDA